MNQAALAKGKLEKLIEHGKRTMWDPTHDVDWAATSAELEGLSGAERQALASVLSLVYYSDSQGREILTTLCRSLDRAPVTDVPLSEKAHEFFTQQMGDEERHAQGIKSLFARLNLELEDQVISHRFYSKVLLADGLFDAKLILIYWYIEIFAKGIFLELKKRFPNTCIDSLFTRIIRDEARHVGFGEVYLPLHVQASGLARRGQMAAAYYTSAVALPGLYKYGHYSRAARLLGLDLSNMFKTGMTEVSQKAERLPASQGFLDLKRPADWVSALL